MLECSCHNLATFEGQIVWRKTHLNVYVWQVESLYYSLVDSKAERFDVMLRQIVIT